MTKYDFTSYKKTRLDSSKWADMYRDNPDIGEGVVPLSVADMEFSIQPQLRDRLTEYVSDANFGYYAPQDSYFKAVGDFMQRRHALTVKKEETALSAGVVTALKKAVMNLTEPGDEIIIFSPVYHPFYRVITGSDRVLSDCPLIKEGKCYSIDYDCFEAKAKSAKAVIFCNPHNPIGRVWSKEELKKVADICERYSLLIISDDIHLDFVREGFRHTFITEVSDYAKKNTILATAPSKSFNLAALECSNIFCFNPSLMKKFNAEEQSITPFGYIACECVYNECDDWLDECLEVIYDNAAYVEEYFAENLPKAAISPLEGTYLMWIDFNYLGLTAEELDKLFKKHGLYLDGGEMFGKAGEGFQRVNLAAPKEVIIKACERFLLAANEAAADK